MILKVVIISIILLALVMLLFGFKLFFKSDAKLPTSSCCRSGIDVQNSGECACVSDETGK